MSRRHAKTIHVAEDIHRFLRTESGRRGISVEDLADLLLRDEINRSGGKTLEVAPVAKQPSVQRAAKKKR
jgi:hypothetical protein